jgi:sugar lactone lactonase YvrE
MSKVVNRRSLVRFALTLLTLTVTALVLGTNVASASKQVVAYFGTEAGSGQQGGQFSGVGDIAVNSSGAGPAEKGDIYVIDTGNNRIQRFAQDGNGTPSNPFDDTFPFVGAWGAGVDAGLAGSGYEVCTVAANCTAGARSGGNGALDQPNGIAVDQDTGVVYVTDASNNRVSVYEGDGTFLRSFGWDVVQSGPGDTGTGFEICVAANGDQCKAGSSGSGAGQLEIEGQGIATSQPDGNPATGTVYLADRRNRRVNTYNLDGSSPSSFGSAANFEDGAPEFVAVDSRGIVYAADRSNNSEVDRYDSLNANGTGVGFLASIAAPPLSIANTQRKGLEVDPDSDGAGPDADVLYSIRDGSVGTTVVQQFGPINAPGLVAPPSAEDDEHGAVAGFNFVDGLGLDTSSNRLFVSTRYPIGGSSNGETAKSGVYVLDNTASTPPSASLDSVSDITATSATIHATIDPNGGPLVTYRLEYSLDGVSWTSKPEVVVGAQESPQQIAAVLSPPPLEPATFYHVRLRVTKAFSPSLTTSEATFTTLTAPPLAETTGAPIRTTTSAQLGGRVSPRNSAATYFFEYGTEGSCESNPCTQTPAQSAGSGGVTGLVSEEIEGLDPNTTYHYRVVADNGQPGSPASGADMTVTTRSSEAPLSHGHFPGPPGSDRAWEQISPPDTGGNPVNEAMGFSADGDRAVYAIAGGTPLSETGNLYSIFFAQRTESGPHEGSWQPKSILPPRGSETGSSRWKATADTSLSSMIAGNSNEVTSKAEIWRLDPQGPPAKLFAGSLTDYEVGIFGTSDDGSRLLALLGGSHDAGYTTSGQNLYDLTSGVPHLASVLPGGLTPSCGVVNNGNAFEPSMHTISADGSRAFFTTNRGFSCGISRAYVRDFDVGEAEPLAPPPVSGPECDTVFVSSTPNAAFLWTKNRLAPEDTTPGSCANNGLDGDIYRIDLGDGTLKCVTCAIPGQDADVYVSFNNGFWRVRESLLVSEDGSRVYFESPHALVPGAPSVEAGGSTYRVNVNTGELAWVGGPKFSLAQSRMTPDGVTMFFSSSSAFLNPLNGSDNGGTSQYYRYDDLDRSLVCLSCPLDGSAALQNVGVIAGSNPMSANGKDIAFTTTTPLVGTDQNTPGPSGTPESGRDVYEWRDGRYFLVTDGLTNTTPQTDGPSVSGISADGRDLYFIVPAQYTPDALDGYRRLYDARIGGGFVYPTAPPPCPLEVCQGTPKGAPEEAMPGTGSFIGPGNVRAHHAKHKKHRARKRHHKAAKKHAKHRANNNRRTAR